MLIFKSFHLNIPNVLTLFRICLLPFIFLPLIPFSSHSMLRLLVSLFVFLICAFTDFLDGYIARRFHICTDWGAYMDPLVDKVLIIGLLIVFLFMPFLEIPLWTVLLIIVRDILVTHLRNYALEHHLDFKTSFLAKIKTTIQMVSCFLILAYMVLSFFLYTRYNLMGENYFTVWLEIQPIMIHFPKFLMIITSFFTGISGFDYFNKLRNSENFLE